MRPAPDAAPAEAFHNPTMNKEGRGTPSTTTNSSAPHRPTERPPSLLAARARSCSARGRPTELQPRRLHTWDVSWRSARVVWAWFGCAGYGMALFSPALVAGALGCKSVGWIVVGDHLDHLAV